MANVPFDDQVTCVEHLPKAASLANAMDTQMHRLHDDLIRLLSELFPREEFIPSPYPDSPDTIQDILETGDCWLNAHLAHVHQSIAIIRKAFINPA